MRISFLIFDLVPVMSNQNLDLSSLISKAHRSTTTF
jgi:hypothetical protein